jgi:hypothetical protein
MATTATTSPSTPEKKKEIIHLHLGLGKYEDMIIGVIKKRFHMEHKSQAVSLALREFYKTMLKVQKEQKTSQSQKK